MNQIRAKLKQLYPYVGDYIPDSVRANANDIWPDLDRYGWHWEAGSGYWQYELELCDADADTVDIAGYVAIRPLERGYALIFVIGPEWPDEELIFGSIQEAKSRLDNMLAVNTPEIPWL